MENSNDQNHEFSAITAHNEGAGAKIICVSSGKGGVGKTVSAVHLAMFARKLGYRVLIIDGAFGMSSVDVVLGLDARYNVRNVFDGTASLRDIILSGPNGIKVVSSGSGLASLQQLTFVQKQILFEDLKSLREDFDLFIFDTSAGIGKNVVFLNQLAQKNLIVTSTEPHAIADAYALIKTLRDSLQTRELDLIVNMTKSDKEGEKVASRIVCVAKEFLQMKVNYIGCVPVDPILSRFILHGKLGSDESSKTFSAQAWGNITRRILDHMNTQTELATQSVFSSIFDSSYSL